MIYFVLTSSLFCNSSVVICLMFGLLFSCARVANRNDRESNESSEVP